MTSWQPMAGELTTARLSLGSWHDGDLDASAELVRERRLGADLPREEVLVRLRRRQVELADTGIALLAVRCDGEFAGYCGLTVGRASLDEPEIAYELLRRFHGRGYATEAARAVVSAARATGRERLWASVRSCNAASFRVLEKLGFTDSGCRLEEDEHGEVHWWMRELC